MPRGRGIMSGVGSGSASGLCGAGTVPGAVSYTHLTLPTKA